MEQLFQDIFFDDSIVKENELVFEGSSLCKSRKRKRKSRRQIKDSPPVEFTDPFVPGPGDTSPVPVDSEIKFKHFHFSDPISLQEVNSSGSSTSFSQPSDDFNDTSSNTSSSHESKSTSQSSATSQTFANFSIPDTFEFIDVDDEPLYPSSNLSSLSAIAMLMSWFASYPGLSKDSFSHLLHLLHTFILPQNNNLPSSYASAYSSVKHLLVQPQEFHACANDCILFRNEYKDLQSCPKCGSNRYSDETQVPQKRFKYLPVFPRIKDMFALPKVSQLLQSHIKWPSHTNVVCDIHDSDEWKSLYAKDGFFAGDVRGISFSLCTDGLNPFSKERCQYSMWPIMLNILNFPSYIRSKAESIILLGIIPGRKEPKHLDPYLAVLVEELNEMCGQTVFDSLTNEYFPLKANIIINVLDYPGQNKVFHCNGAGAYAGCVYCKIKGEYSKTLKKMVYLGHRRFLTPLHPLHDDTTLFPHKKDKHHPPAQKHMAYIDRYNDKYEQAPDAKRKKLSRKSGCKGSYVLRGLPEHNRVTSTPAEPMHLIKNISEHLVRLISGVEDSRRVREEERLRNRFESSWITTSTQLPPAPFSLLKDQIICANNRAKSIRIPSTFDWRPCAIFTCSGMKSHEWKEIICSGILKFCIRDLIGPQQQSTLFVFCDVMTRLCSHVVDAQTSENLEADTHHALALLERDFPVSLNVIVFHLLHHLPSYIKKFGPVSGYWMYPFERFNSWIARRVKNRRYPEATVMETYRIYEWFIRLSMSGKLPTTFSSIFDWSEEGGDDILQRSSLGSLDDSQLSHIQQYYRQINTDYDSLCNRYFGEREKARKRHELRYFPSMEEWTPSIGSPLCEKEMLMCLGPSKEIRIFQSVDYEVSRGRVIKFTSESTSTSSTCSSIIAIYSSSGLHFGNIKVLFSHTFCEFTQKFAYIKWYGNTEYDEISCFYTVHTDASIDINPIVLVSDLIGPFVTALDIIDSNKLWILNSNQFGTTQND